MKISLVLGPRQALSRQTAWGCLTTNLAMPGAGSIAAGRPIGYVQLGFTAIGFALTTLFGIPLIAWGIAHWDKLYGSNRDVEAAFHSTWHLMKWALAGIGIFFFTWIWALLTSLQILYSARQTEESGLPPRLS